MKPKEFVKQYQELVGQAPDGLVVFSIIDNMEGISTCIQGNSDDLSNMIANIMHDHKDIKDMVCKALICVQQHQSQILNENE